MQTPFGHVTYCTNIHSGESWPAHFAQLKEHVPLIKKAVSPHEPFGLGLRLSNLASLELVAEQNVIEFKNWLQKEGVYVFTLNGFPYGGFHHTVVKDDVHTPDWQTEERLDYTLRLASLLAALLPDGLEGGISTSPLSYRFWFDAQQKEAAKTKATENIVRLVAQLNQIKQETGKTIHLDIEPEPDGLLETGAEFLNWFAQTLLPLGKVYLKEQLDIDEEEAVMLVQTHVQLCYDVCHFAIGYEVQSTFLDQLQNAGIKVGKLQISAALKAQLPEGKAEKEKVLQAFAQFNEPVYLHQVVAQAANGNLMRYRDLPQALSDGEATSTKEWRAHFHVPLFEKSYGLLQSTQQDITEVLQWQCAQPFTQHLEVETYTWEVLSHDLKLPLTASIIRELQWVLATLVKGKTNIL